MFQNNLNFGLAHSHSVDYIVGMYDDGLIPTSNGGRTIDELERQAYITGDLHSVALWGMLHDLETALNVAARLEDA